MPTKQVSANFTANFKVGDNICHNCDVLVDLYENNNEGSFNKPIVIQAASIIEAALGQIIERAQNFNQEGVPNISPADQAEIAGKQIEKFAVTIDVMKKYSILDGASANIYDDLHKIRKYRNRIHIDIDLDFTVEVDEIKIFDDYLALWSIQLMTLVLEYLGQSYPRPPHANHVADFTVPEL